MKPLYVKKNGTVNKVSGVAMPNTFPANRVGYDNTASELEATNTQDAIDEVVDIVADKVDKVSSATNGNLAGLNASGNLVDSGIGVTNGKIDASITGDAATVNGKTVAVNVPSGAVFTDTDTKVTQTATSDNKDYEVLFSATNDNTTRIEGARKANNLKFNPSTGNLQATKLNGVDIGSSPKFTDTTYSNATTSAAGLMSAADKTAVNTIGNKADKVSGATNGNLALLNSNGNLADSAINISNIMTLEATFQMQGGGTTVIEFSGEAACRMPHYLLIVCGQDGCSSPITIAFTGSWIGVSTIAGVTISDSLSGNLTVNGKKLYIPDIYNGWGQTKLYNLIPTDKVTYTVTRV